MNKIGMGWCVILLVSAVSAERYSFVGHRAQGMGGANAATVNDSSAQWQNPAAFGFFNREPDPVDGWATNPVSQVSMVVTNMPVTNYVAAAESSDTNTVAAAESDDTNAVAEVESSDTNIVADVDGAATNGVPETTDMDDVLAAMDQANSSTNFTVEMALVTNEVYDVTYEVVPVQIVPDRARADNAKLQENDWGWNVLGVGVGYTMTDDMPEYITQLGLIDFDFVNGDGLDGSIENVESSLALGSALYGLGSNPDNAFYVDATAGMNFRFGRWGIGVRAFGEVAGFVDTLDTTNLGIEQTEAAFVGAINNAAGLDGGFNPVGYTYKSINPGDLNISGTAAGDSAEAYIDYQLTQLKNDGVLNDQNVQDAVTMANLVTYGVPTTDPTSFENNQSTVTARGFGLFEVPVSFGYAFNDNLSVGITAKGMYGTVTGTKVLFTEEDSFESAVDNLEENTEASLNFGLDLGVLYRMKMLQFAAVAHNINAPKFDGFTDTIEVEDDNGNIVATVPIDVPDYTIDPQVTLGMAFIPSKRFMLEMSYDVLETGTLMKNYNIQRLSFGGELDIWLLAFRLGAYNNLAADWQDWIATGGVGLNLWAMRLDVGGAYSIGANAEYEGTEIPEEARLFASLSMEF